MKMRWKFGIAAGIILAIFTLYPQVRMIYLRGQQWQGNYAITDVDEVAYAAYLQSLIDGQPRKNDAYLKLSDTPETPLPESLFSIQFASAYTVAIPARMFGVSARTAMTVTGVLAAFFAGLSVFWLIGKMTDDSLFALTGSLIVFCGGALAGGEGAILDILGVRVAGPFFPGFRRYIPAVALPLLFAFFGLLWLLVKTEDKKRRLGYGAAAFLLFGFTVFSYFYVWTTAAAWLACVIGLWLLVRPKNWAADVKNFLMIAAGCFLWLIPYAIMLSNRSATNDNVQLLELSHAPDLTRVPEYIGLAALIILAFGITRKKIDLKEHLTLFTAAFALVPFAVHNQQILTGKSLQPVHFDLFTVNYLAILALILAVWQLLKGIVSFESISMRLAIATVCLTAVGWGLIECHFTTRVIDAINIERDKGFPSAKRLKEIALNESGKPGTVMAYSIWSGDDLPTNAPQPVLWAFHQMVFGGGLHQENKERYYQHLYFQNISEKQLAEELRDGNFSPIIALFGWGRYSNRLSSTFHPLTEAEIIEEAARFGTFTKTFHPKNSPQTVLSYLAVPNKGQVDFSNIDKWYERGTGETHGEYTLYKVKLRSY